MPAGNGAALTGAQAAPILLIALRLTSTVLCNVRRSFSAFCRFFRNWVASFIIIPVLQWDRGTGKRAGEVHTRQVHKRSSAHDAAQASILGSAPIAAAAAGAEEPHGAVCLERQVESE